MYFKNTVLFVLLFFSCLFSQTWTTQNSNTLSTLWDIKFYDLYNGVAVGGAGTIIKTVNAGQMWTVKNSGTTALLICVTSLIDKPYIFYSWGMESPILKSTDYGETWNAISLTGHPGLLGGGWIFNESVFVVALASSAYQNSKILKTTNGGISWDTVFSPVGGGWISYMHFPTSTTGYATASGGYIYKTTDQGSSWTVLNVGMPLWMSAVFFKDENLGFVGGGDFNTMTGAFIKTTNGGSNWDIKLVNYAGAKIAFTGADKNIALGLGSHNPSGASDLYKSVNEGDTWTQLTTGDSLYGFYFINEYYGYVVGIAGLLKQYVSSSSVQENTQKPARFELWQNYPNPFNPETNIRYYLPEKSYVTVYIYDVEGNMIENLLSEMEYAGEHVIRWSAKNFSSGVYFCEVIAGGIHKTEKMILLK